MRFSIMKEFNMLIWITQLGFSVAMPLAGFTLIGFWLKENSIWAYGLYCAAAHWA